MKTLLLLGLAMVGMSCASKDAVSTTGSGGGPGSGGLSAPGGHAGTGSGGNATAGAPGSGGMASGGLGAAGTLGGGGDGGRAGRGGNGSSGGAGDGGRAGRAGSDGSGGVGGSTPADGGTDALLCESAQCKRPYECIRACGGAIEYTGCCECVAPLFDNFNNLACKGMGGAGGASCGQLQTGYASALEKAKECHPAISSRQPCSTAAKATLGCACTTYVDDASGLKAYEDAWAMAGCQVICALACVNAQPHICDPAGSTTPGLGVCRDSPAPP